MHAHENKQWALYKELELIPDSVPEPQKVYPNAGIALVKQIWKSLVDAMIISQEPKVWQAADGSGNVWWHVYDPIAARTLYMASEDEVLHWLDQYHNIH